MLTPQEQHTPSAARLPPLVPAVDPGREAAAAVAERSPEQSLQRGPLAPQSLAIPAGALEPSTHSRSFALERAITAPGYTNGFENTATGFAALQANTTGYRNTATGSTALHANITGTANTASGYAALYSNTNGLGNTASGYKALRSNTSGSRNTASGLVALYNTTGSGNTASGYAALLSNTTGSRNTALGYKAGYYNETNSESIFINNQGSLADSATIKIGTQGTQTSTFVAGISGVAVSGTAVLVSPSGQLGVASSSRDVKREISTLAPLAERLLALRPVSFRYRQLGANGDRHSDTPLEYGLVAEEVAEVFPELVIYDEHGKPQTVKYHLLGSLLLRALQEQQEVLEKQRSTAQRQQEENRVTVQRLASRVAALESRSRR